MYVFQVKYIQNNIFVVIELKQFSELFSKFIINYIFKKKKIVLNFEFKLENLIFNFYKRNIKILKN